jgi:agmatine/peptidylarginine deiminase
MAVEGRTMLDPDDKYRNYVPCPFWAMDSGEWLKYADGLKGDDRKLLSEIPFKWAFVRPNDAASALAFLDDIGASSDEINEDVIESVEEGMPTFDELVAEGSVSWSTESSLETPRYRFRMIPEWEKMSGVILNWPVFYPPLWNVYRDMIEALDHVRTYLRVPQGYLGAASLAWLQGRGIDLGRVQAIPGPIGDIWPRDHSPLFGVDTYSGEPIAHKFAFAAYYEEYREKYRHIVEVDDAFAWTEGFRLARSEIMMDGGSVVTDGDGTYVITRRVIEDNDRIANVREKIRAWLGADRLVVVDEEPGDMLGHVCNFKFIGRGTAVVGRPDRKNTPLSRYLSEVASELSDLGYDVAELPCGTEFKHCPGWEYENYPGAYANSLMVNRRILVPQYSREDMSDLNARALETYAELLPGWEIVPIEASIIGNGGGAINCSSKEVPDPRHASRD